MALSPIGNVTYINQNSQLGSIQHANSMQKVDFALNANMQEFVDKLKAVQEVAPAPQVQATDPDSEQAKKRGFAHEEDKKEDEENGQEQGNELRAVVEEDVVCQEESHHLLDIRA